jgi:hypothetical protein
MGYFVSEGKVIKIFEVTRGSKDSTSRGIYKAQRKTPTWRKSTLYDAQLYKPININGAIAYMGILTLYDKVPTLLSRLHKSTQRLMD